MRSLLILITMLSTIPLSQLANAQGETTDETQKVEVSPLETFYLRREEDGKLIPFFNIPFDKFDEIYRQLTDGTAEPVDLFSIRSAKIVAKVRNDIAELEIELTIDSKTDGEVNIPIALNEAIFSNHSSKHPVIRKGNGYYVQAQVKKGENIKIPLTAKRKIGINGREKTLNLDLPQATFSSLDIHEMIGNVGFDPPVSAISKTISPFYPDGTSIEIQGIKEKTSVTWSEQRPSEMMVDNPPDLPISVAVIVRENEVNYQASIDLSAVSNLKEIRLGLPVNATSVTANKGVAVSAASAIDNQWMSYVVTPEGDTGLPRTTKVDWTITGSESLKLVGFQLFGGKLDRGSLKIESDLSTDFAVVREYNLSEKKKETGINGWVYTFGTTQFSADLIRFQNPTDSNTRIDYQVEFGFKETRMTMQVPIEVFQGPESTINLKFFDWKPSPNQALFNGLAVVDNAVTISRSLLTSDTGSITLLFERDTPDDPTHQFLLPEVSSEFVAQRTVSLTCDPLVEVMLDYRQNPSIAPASNFELEKIISGKSISVEARGNQSLQLKVRIETKQLAAQLKQDLKLVEQHGQLHYSVSNHVASNRSFDQLVFQFDLNDAIRFEVNGEDTIHQQITVDNKPYYLVELPAESSEAKVVIRWPSGTAESLGLDFPIPTLYFPRSLTDDASPEVINLGGRTWSPIHPQTRLELQIAPTTKASLGSGWTLANELGQQVNRFVPTPSPKNTTEKKRLSQLQFESLTQISDELTIGKVWVQTTLNSDYRTDRYTIQFRPQSSLINWQLPDNTKLANCRLNGRDISNAYDSVSNQLSTTFATYMEQQVIELEVRYYAFQTTGSISLHLPRTRSLIWSQDLYWSLEIPEDQYVLFISDNLSISYALDWSGFFLQPVPQMSERQMQRWIGIEPGSEVVASRNKYLFSSFGYSDRTTAFIVSKKKLVFAFGLLFVTLGSAFVTIRFIRNPYFIIVVATALLSLGVWYPLWFMQLLQIEIFAACLIGAGLIIAKVSNWLRPPQQETTIETNVPWLTLAGTPETAGQSGPPARESEAESEQ